PAKTIRHHRRRRADRTPRKPRPLPPQHAPPPQTQRHTDHLDTKSLLSGPILENLALRPPHGPRRSHQLAGPHHPHPTLPSHRLRALRWLLGPAPAQHAQNLEAPFPPLFRPRLHDARPAEAVAASPLPKSAQSSIVFANRSSSRAIPVIVQADSTCNRMRRSVPSVSRKRRITCTAPK